MSLPLFSSTNWVRVVGSDGYSSAPRVVRSTCSVRQKQFVHSTQRDSSSLSSEDECGLDGFGEMSHPQIPPCVTVVLLLPGSPPHILSPGPKLGLLTVEVGVFLPRGESQSPSSVGLCSFGLVLSLR